MPEVHGQARRVRLMPVLRTYRGQHLSLRRSRVSGACIGALLCLLALAALSACTSSKKKESASGAVAAPGAVAAQPQPQPQPQPTTTAHGPATAELFQSAADLQNDPAVERWLSGTDTLAEAPPAVRHALVALRAWGASGEGIAVPEMEKLERIAPLLRLARIVTKDAGEPQGMLDVLGVARALRAPGNFGIVQATGFALAGEVYSALRRADPAAPPPVAVAAQRELAPTQAEVLAFARESVLWSVRLARQVTWASLEREVAGAAPTASAAADDSAEILHAAAEVERYRREAKLPLGEGWLRADYDAYAAFWDETERRVNAAQDARSVARIAAEQLAAATTHPTSMLVRLLGPMALSDRLSGIIEDIEAKVSTLHAELPR